MDVFKVFLTALLSAASMFVITKVMGHKQVAQLDFFDYVSGITIGSIAAELATEIEKPYKPLIALGIYGAVSISLNFLAHKFPKTRKYINGTPTIIMNGGKLYRKNLKAAKLDLSEFLLLCRENGYFDLREISTAVFEHNGKLSILPRAAARPVTPTDLKIPVNSAHIGTELIMDGRIMGENLTRIGKDADWLISELRPLGYTSAREILLCVFREGESTLEVYPIE